MGLPLAVHIFNKKYPRHVPFSDIRMIKKSLHERSKLLRLRHLILMILRTLAILLLLLCFLQPVFSQFSSKEQNDEAERQVIIVLDHSLSMFAKEGGLSPHQQALIEIEKIVNSLSSSDQANLLVAGRQVEKCFQAPDRNHRELLAYAQALPESQEEVDLEKAIIMAGRELREHEGRSEIYFISDFQRSNWGAIDLSSVNPKNRLFFVNVSSGIIENRAISGVELKEASILAGSLVPAEVIVSNFSSTAFKDRLEIRIDEKESLFYEVEVAPWSKSKVHVNIPLHRQGIHQVVALLSPDSLPADNKFFFTLNARDKEEVLIVSDVEPALGRANHLITSALNPYKNQSGALLPRYVNLSDLAPMHLSTSSKVFISGAARINESQAQMLNEFLRKGGSLVYFLDGQFDPINLQTLQKQLPVELPFKIGERQTSKHIPRGRIKIRSGFFRSRYLRLFHGDARRHLADLDFYSYYQAKVSNHGKVLLTYAEGTPAMGSCSVGLGQVILCNFSVEEGESNMALQNIFPAWIQEMVRHMSTEARHAELFEAGDKLQKEVWKSELTNSKFHSPGKDRLKLNFTKVNDERVIAYFTPKSVGHYQLKQANETLYSFPVNCSPNESDLRSLDTALLAARSETPITQVRGQEAYEEIKSGQKVYHWFLLGCIAFLFGELIFSNIFRRLAAWLSTIPLSTLGS